MLRRAGPPFLAPAPLLLLGLVGWASLAGIGISHSKAGKEVEAAYLCLAGLEETVHNTSRTCPWRAYPSCYERVLHVLLCKRRFAANTGSDAVVLLIWAGFALCFLTRLV